MGRATDSFPGRVLLWLTLTFSLLSLLSLIFTVVIDVGPKKIFVQSDLAVVPDFLFYAGYGLFSLTFITSLFGFICLYRRWQKLFILHVVLNALFSVAIILIGAGLLFQFNGISNVEGLNQTYNDILQSYGDFYVEQSLSGDEEVRASGTIVQDTFECCGSDAEVLLNVERFNMDNAMFLKLGSMKSS